MSAAGRLGYVVLQVTSSKRDARTRKRFAWRIIVDVLEAREVERTWRRRGCAVGRLPYSPSTSAAADDSP